MLTLFPGCAPANGEFLQVGGPEIHEVAVGPVHAGVIEPGPCRGRSAGRGRDDVVAVHRDPQVERPRVRDRSGRRDGDTSPRCRSA